MLTNNKKQILQQLIADLSKNELAWVNGYISGLLNEGLISMPLSTSQNITDNITIIYATESGNSKFLATELTAKLKARKINVKLKAANQYRTSDLSNETYVIFVISTQGDGEFPDSGKKFAEFVWKIQGGLEKLNYAVIALGDTNYPLFCKAGKDLDHKLLELKAKQLFPAIELDLDFEQRKDEVLAKVETVLNGEGSTSPAIIANTTKVSKPYYFGRIISNINLNDIDSTKETHHIEIAFEEEVHYEPGDALAIVLDAADLGQNSGEKNLPRLYSISSSINEYNQEAHITVAVVKYIDENNSAQKGLFSSYLSALNPDDRVKFYINKNRQFKLPADDKDIIMIGAGTGVAPFRAFLSERNYRGAIGDGFGKNWLFFGERNSSSDFLYQTEWQAHLESGLLAKMDVAFSRDFDRKVYVQHKLHENSKEVYKWLEKGSYFYICGDKKHMAKDVEEALLDIIMKQGNKNAEAAQEYLNNLDEQGRYLKDVY